MAVATRFREALGFPAKAGDDCVRCTLGQRAVMRAISYCMALAPMWIMRRLRQVQPFLESLFET